MAVKTTKKNLRKSTSLGTSYVSFLIRNLLFNFGFILFLIFSASSIQLVAQTNPKQGKKMFGRCDLIIRIIFFFLFFTSWPLSSYGKIGDYYVWGIFRDYYLYVFSSWCLA